MEYTDRSPFSEFEADAGIMVFDSISFDQKENYFSFFIKEEEKFIERHKDNPSIEIRMGLMKIGNVWLIPMMVLINRDFDMLYESFFNYYATSGMGKEHIKALSTQDKIYIAFYNTNNEKSRLIETRNTIKADMMEFGMRLSSMKPWEMEEFDNAKAAVYNMFPSPLMLWDRLNH